MTAQLTPITVARGDGIGPEIMEAVLAVLKAAGARLEIEEIEIGKPVYERGIMTGIAPDAWESLRRTGIFLKSPITTPQGGGYKSLNVTIRKALGLYANVRPCVSYHPFVRTRHPDMDVVIVRENEEDLYAGIEYRHTQESYECMKLVTRAGCEKVIRYAFEYARTHHRGKVTAFVKDNIMKMTDGLFHSVFKEVAEFYPDIQHDSLIVDIGTARLADTPERFDVIVTLNLYGDIISDVAAQIAGSVGLAGSANIGDRFAMFEAIHGSAPDIAGKGVANPSGLLHGAIQMLVHIGQPDIAETIHNAWLTALEEGCHTPDIFDRQHSRKRCTTAEFGEAVIERLGRQPATLKPVTYGAEDKRNAAGIRLTLPAMQKKELIGVDVFIDDRDRQPAEIAAEISPLAGPDFDLDLISARGQKLWPGDGGGETFNVDHWRCRFLSPDGATGNTAVVNLLKRLNAAAIDFIKVEHLYSFDGKAGFSRDQGA
jgi:isocitrate dehydrogenase